MKKQEIEIHNGRTHVCVGLCVFHVSIRFCTALMVQIADVNTVNAEAKMWMMGDGCNVRARAGKGLIDGPPKPGLLHVHRG